MSLKYSRKLSQLKWSVLVVALGGCTVPTQPVATFWQKLGIPQADAAFRAGVLNKSGDYPDLEKKPPVLPISDLQNLQSPNPLLKNAAEIKKDKDLKPQKLKALKYLASVGCVCPGEKEKVVEALLAGLNDCDCEVRKAALEAVCAAIKSCGPCGGDPCVDTCCTEAIQKKLEEMANKQDDKGCFVEPSAQLRSLAANVLAACPALPKKEDKKTGPVGEGGATGEGEEEKGASEASPSDEGEKSTTNTMPRELDVAPVTARISSASYGDVDIHPVVHQVKQESSENQPVNDILTPEQAANLVVCSKVEEATEAGSVIVSMPAVYQLEEGMLMVVIDSTGSLSSSQIIKVEAEKLTLRLERPEIKENLFAKGARVGLVAK
jgi:hypothetical protein